MPEQHLNRVTFLGRVGADPDVRYTGEVQGQCSCSFNVATNQSWKDETGELVTKTDWHRCVAWGKIAETCRDYVRKGHRIYLEGSLHTRQYEDKGEKKYITEVKINKVLLQEFPNKNAMIGSADIPPLSDSDIAQFYGGGEVKEFKSEQIADDLPF